MIQVEGLSYRFEQQLILNELSISFPNNRLIGLIGPNGTGKSTLLQLLAGARKLQSGRVHVDGKPIESYSKRELAKTIAVLQQGGLEPLPYTVQQVLEMGRYPYLSWLGVEGYDSRSIIEEAIERTEIAHLREHRLNELSGGERQRVALAKVWVQRPRILMLDEPTTYLDIGYQQMIMDFIAKWQKDEQLLVIAVMHDINLAAMYCHEIIALHEGKVYASGRPQEVLTSELLADLYDADTSIVTHPQLSVPQMLLQRRI